MKFVACNESNVQASIVVKDLLKAMDMPNEAHWKGSIRNRKSIVDTRMKELTYECTYKENNSEILMLKAYRDRIMQETRKQEQV